MIDATPLVVSVKSWLSGSGVADLWPLALAVGAVGLFVILRRILALVLRLVATAALAGLDGSRLDAFAGDGKLGALVGALPPWLPDAAHAVTALILATWLLKSRLGVLGTPPARDQAMN